MAKKLKFERSATADNPMTQAEVQSADQVLARLIASAYAADHPELFRSEPCDTPIMDGPSPDAAALSFHGAENAGITPAGETNARIE